MRKREMTTSWEQEDMNEVIETYALDNKSLEEIQKIKKSLYWEAECLHEKMCRLENDAEMIDLYLKMNEGV